MISLQEKYDFICRQLAIKHVDHWEKDGLLELKPRIYFQFDIAPMTVDEAIEMAIKSE